MKKEPLSNLLLFQNYHHKKFLNIMRISTFLLFVCVFTSFAAKTNSQNARVNINGNNLTISEFIDQVEKQTDYLFVYSKNELNVNGELSLNAGTKSVAQYLNEAFTNTDVKYVFENDYIVLTKNVVSAVIQQGKTVTGTVVDDLGEPIIGANIVVKGTTIGTVTDYDGKYTLPDVPDNAVLQVSYIGYLTREITVGTQSVVNVTLSEDSQALDEVVVVGYGTMRKSDVTGSIAVTKGEDMVKQQNFSPLDALRGKAAGVNIFSNSSQPGAYNNRVVIRGNSTILASNEPLYVVDGVVMSDFHMVNPNDIESIEVLKDASSAAIYGARGANGVILVTTKRGNKDQGTIVSYQGSVSMNTASRYMDTMNAQEWTDAFMKGLENENKWQGKNWSMNRADWFTDRDYFDASGNPLYDTDWQREATRTSVSHNHQLNIQQAGQTSSMGAFLNYTDMQGVVNNTYTKRLNAKFAYDAKPLSWLSTSVNLMVNHTWGRYTPEDGGGQEARRTMIEMLPWLPIRDKNGRYTTSSTSSSMNEIYGFEGMSNPVMILDLQKRMRYNTKIFGNAALTFHLMDGLDLKTQLGIDSQHKPYKAYSSITLNNISMPNGWAERQHDEMLYWQEETYLTYNKVFGLHRINAMAGLSWQEYTKHWDKSRTEGFDDDFYEYYNMNVGTLPNAPESSWERWRMNSYFLRFAYTYNDRYSATVTGRYDGSSKFGKNNKYAFFPSAGLAWNVSNEDFLVENPVISNMKLHTSYGITGNSEIGTYRSLANVSATTSLLNGSRAPFSYISSMANPDLKWEKTGMWDIGIDLGMFNQRLTLDLSYYNKKTTDLLLEQPLPRSTGFNYVTSNIGSIRNQGFDMMISGRPIQTRDFLWTISLNANYNKNEVLKLGENDEDIYTNSWVGGAEGVIRVGQPLNSFYGYKRFGVYTVQDYDAGACDMNQIGRAKRSDEKEILGKGTPDWTGSFINNLSYKNFDLTLDFQFVYGVETMQQFYHSVYDRFGITNGLKSILYDAYDGTNPNTMQQAVYLMNSGHAGQDTTIDSAWIVDGSYLRLNMIQLGYTLTPQQARALKLSGLRFYVSANNLFLITSGDFAGYDPESTSQIGNATDMNIKFGQNMTFFSYPRPTTYTLGVNVTF
ncbi:MAG: TonB-dependent receptor [Tannerellaceae bacterium]|jgi:TonB-linked SusC/RagA family outer membrane protein|nr:TonB-dependent receptor [Tannerellaceae bacterium]